MSRFFRAAGFAAASLFLLSGIVPVQPSRAWDLNATAGLSELTDPAAPSGAALGAPVPAATAAATVPVPAEPVEPAEPEPPVRRTLAELVAEHSGVRPADSEQECLAGAVYFEAKGEPLQGQLTVAEVILNRARSGRFPASICGVVKQRGQFSFIRGGRFPPIARSSAAWRKAVAIARIAQADLADGAAPRALFFHARYVSPRWRLTRIATVGNHIFYR